MIKIKKQNILTIYMFLWWFLLPLVLILIHHYLISLDLIVDFLFGNEKYDAVPIGIYIGGGSLMGLISNFKYENECPMIQFSTMNIFGVVFSIGLILSPLFR